MDKPSDTRQPVVDALFGNASMLEKSYPCSFDLSQDELLVDFPD